MYDTEVAWVEAFMVEEWPFFLDIGVYGRTDTTSKEKQLLIWLKCLGWELTS